MPALLSVAASEGINMLRNTPSILATLHENIQVARAILDRVDCITIPSHPASPIIHIYIKNSKSSLHPSSAATMITSTKASNPTSILPKDAANWDWDIPAEEKILQDVVDEALAQGVLITKAKRLRGQELVEARPSIRLALTSALTKKETEKAINVVKHALVKVLGKRR
jgi:serine palmitoyltransferase